MSQTNQFHVHSIEKANLEFENAWTSVLELSKFMGTENDVLAASHRVLSYNPQNKVIQNNNKELFQASSIICDFIENKLQFIQSNPDDVFSWASLAKCYLLLDDFPNSFSSSAHVLRIDRNHVDPTFWFTAAIVYQHFNYHNDALEFYTLAKNQNPSYSNSNDFNLRFAILLRTLGKYDESLLLFKKIKND